MFASLARCYRCYCGPSSFLYESVAPATVQGVQGPKAGVGRSCTQVAASCLGTDRGEDPGSQAHLLNVPGGSCLGTPAQ